MRVLVGVGGGFVGSVLDSRVASLAHLLDAELIEHVLIVVVTGGNEIGLLGLALPLDLAGRWGRRQECEGDQRQRSRSQHATRKLAISLCHRYLLAKTR